jgi:hypothetical protein
MNKTHRILLSLLLFGLSASAQAMKCMPLYGNWCGINYPRAGDFPPPVDAFDAACMRHDLCRGGPAAGGACDVQFVQELRGLALTYGYLPRPLRWAEYLIRVKEGGNPFSGTPMPNPMDALGAMSSLSYPCW